MTAIVLALLASVAWGASDFVGGRASQGRAVVGVMILTRPVALVAVALVALLGGGDLVGDRWLEAVLSGVSLFVGIVALYRALAIGPMSVVAPIFATGAIVPVLWGIADGEAPTAWTFVGLAIAVAGSVLAARAPSVAGARTDPRGLAFAVVAAFGIGLGLALTDLAAEHDAVAAIVVERATEVVLAALVLLARPSRIRAAVARPGILPLAGILDVSASLLFAIASRTGLLPVVSVLSSLYPVVTVLLARALLDERLSRPQTAGAALTLVGVAVVAAAG